MIGNVAEWTSTGACAYRNDCADPPGMSFYAMRGGPDWQMDLAAERALVSYDVHLDAWDQATSPGLGFRCASDGSSP